MIDKKIVRPPEMKIYSRDHRRERGRMSPKEKQIKSVIRAKDRKEKING